MPKNWKGNFSVLNILILGFWLRKQWNIISCDRMKRSSFCDFIFSRQGKQLEALIIAYFKNNVIIYWIGSEWPWCAKYSLVLVWNQIYWHINLVINLHILQAQMFYIFMYNYLYFIVFSFWNPVPRAFTFKICLTLEQYKIRWINFFCLINKFTNF